MEKQKEIKFTKDDFQLCQNDNVIRDKKIDTAPTSFAKDAFKRFRKNKSSVVAACIIGTMLLLTAIVPFVSPHKVKESLPYQTYLPPRILPSGTGFWDGTQKLKQVTYDYINNEVIGYKSDSIIEGTLKTTKLGDNKINASNGIPGVFGGTLIIENEGKEAQVNASNYHPINASNLELNTNIQLKLDFEEVTSDIYGSQAEFEIVLINNATSKVEAEKQVVVLKSLSKDITDTTINITDKVKAAGINELTNAKVYFRVNRATEGESTFLAMNSFEFTTSASNESNISKKLSEISMTDANDKMLQSVIQETGDNKFLPGYLQPEHANINLYNADIVYASFTYDAYDAAFGIKENQKIDHFTFLDYIKKGWIKYDFAIGPESFERLSDECPIESINEVNVIGKPNLGYFYEVDCNVHMYSYYGYTSMPAFIFGTDADGHDLFTKVFSGLSLSLALAIGVGLFCIAFGIVWGAISGYYGGQIDIFMERFTEIFGRIPSVVLIPLLLTLIGRNLFSLGVVFCLTSWMGMASVTRANFYRYKGREYVLASRTLGAKDNRLIFKHILPNAAGMIITSAVMVIPSVIGAEAGVAYYGLGLTSSNTLGIIMSNNQGAINFQPLLILFPAALYSLLLISFNLFGNGLRDAFNTSLRGSE